MLNHAYLIVACRVTPSANSTYPAAHRRSFIERKPSLPKHERQTLSYFKKSCLRIALEIMKFRMMTLKEDHDVYSGAIPSLDPNHFRRKS